MTTKSDTPKNPMTLKDWLLVVVSLIGVGGFVGQYFVNQYRLSEIEATTTEHTKNISALQSFQVQQQQLDSDFSNHMKDTAIHMTSEKQQLMVQQAIQPLMTEVTKLQLRAENQDKQSDRIEHLLKDMQGKIGQ